MAKNVAPILVVAFGLIVSNSAFRYSVSRIQGITVSNVDGVLQCDQIECPTGTALCHVVKQNTEENLFKLMRENICYDIDGKILKEKLWSEDGSENKRVNVQIDMNSQGSISLTSTNTGGIGLNLGVVSQTVNAILSQVGSFLTNLF